MASNFRASISFLLLLGFVFFSPISAEEAAEAPTSHVLTLDASNFADEVAKHPFVVVEFYAPWCGHCKKLEPEYEKAAEALSKHDVPIVLAKVDANEKSNKELASQYEVSGFPTLKIFRNGGKSVQDYKGPREVEGIVEYLKKQAGPASAVIGSAEDADTIIDEKKVFVVGVFSEFSGEEFDNFMTVAEKLRSEYDFAHTLDAKLIPKGESSVTIPVVRVLKPFDELFVDSKDFHLDALEMFIQQASTPVVTLFNKDPANHPFVMKFFNSADAKAMLFVNFSSESIEEFKSKYHNVAENFKGKNISFLLGDIEAGTGAFQYFGLREEQVPLIIIQTNDGQKYLNANVEPHKIADWLKDYTDGNVKPYRKSEPIPEANNEPVKVVVGDNLHDVVFNSGKNVLIEFYAPWCGHCQKLAPILDEVATSLESDSSIVIAKMDGTANDVPSEFEVHGYPTLYFLSASGEKKQYEGGRSKEDIIDFIEKNKVSIAQPESDPAQSEPLKDEL